MIYKLTYPTKSLKGKIKLSGSKSESNRAMVINHLLGDFSLIQNLSDSDDTKTLKELLSRIDDTEEFDVGHAGTCMRFLTSIFSITEGERILKGSERMHQRPIHPLVDALRQIGAQIEYLGKEGFPPLKIKGTKLLSNSVSIKGNVSSQYISSLLMIAPCINGIELKIEGELVSKPYIDMTIKMMRACGAQIDFKGNLIKVSGDYEKPYLLVESDWSSASYWYEAASFCDEVDLEIVGLKKEGSLQGDSAVQSLYENLGIVTESSNSGIRLSKINFDNTDLTEFDFTNCPDIAQTLSCTAIAFDYEFVLQGLMTLRIKETDRVEALKNELKKIGQKALESQNSLIIKADESNLKPSIISTYKDHRMAMAFAMLVFYFGEISIENPEVVSKSYSNFWKDLQMIGVEINQ